MKYKELQALKPADLEKKQAEIEIELIKLRSQVATGTPPKNPGQIKQFKKIIARIKTLQTAQSKQSKEEKQ